MKYLIWYYDKVRSIILHLFAKSTITSNAPGETVPLLTSLNRRLGTAFTFFFPLASPIATFLFCVFFFVPVANLKKVNSWVSWLMIVPLFVLLFISHRGFDGWSSFKSERKSNTQKKIDLNCFKGGWSNFIAPNRYVRPLG